MCDEYYDARTKAFWRALADVSELEIDAREDKKEETLERPIVIQPIELPKTKPKALLR